MPFTLAHPAAVLPLFRRPLVPAGLIAGAVAPDIPYYLRATGLPVSAESWYEPLVNATTSHDVVGAVVTSLPLALLLYLSLAASARPASTVLSDRIRWRYRQVDRSDPWKYGLWALLSLAIGVATHLVWDQFTEGWPFLASGVAHKMSVAGVRLDRLLQHGSTVIGLLVVTVYLIRCRHRWLPARGSETASRLAKLLLGVIITGALGAAGIASLRWDSPLDVATLLTNLAIGFGLGTLLALFAVVAVWWLNSLKRTVGAWIVRGEAP